MKPGRKTEYLFKDRATDLTQAFNFLARAIYIHRCFTISLGIDLIVFLAFGIRAREEQWSIAAILLGLVILVFVSRFLGSWLLSGVAALRKFAALNFGDGKPSNKASALWMVGFMALGLLLELLPRLAKLNWIGIAIVLTVLGAASPFAYHNMKSGLKRLTSEVEARHATLRDANEIIVFCHFMAMAAARAISVVGLLWGGSTYSFLAHFALSASLLSYLRPTADLTAVRCKNCLQFTARTIARKGRCPSCCVKADTALHK